MELGSLLSRGRNIKVGPKMLEAKAKVIANKIERIKPIFCYKCNSPIYIKSIELPWDWRVRLIPYDFHSASRHYCSNKGVPIIKSIGVNGVLFQ